MALIIKKKKMNDFLIATRECTDVNVARRLFSQLVNGCATYGSKGNYYQGFRNDSCYVYHIEKINTKVLQHKIPRAPKGKKKPLKNRESVIIPGKVVLRIFKFEESEFKTLKQHTRHFDVYM